MLGFYFWIQFNIFAAYVQKQRMHCYLGRPQSKNLNKYTFCA